MMNFYFFVNILLQSVYLRFTMLFKDVTKGRRSVFNIIFVAIVEFIT